MRHQFSRADSFGIRTMVVTAAIAAQYLLACTEQRPLVLIDADGSHRLEYDCNDIKPQAESAEDIEVIRVNLEGITNDLRNQQKLVTLQSIARVAKRQDFRRLERIVVHYKCSGGEVTEESQ